ncbi:MAG TPA: serine/threonine-protein kinase [Kofleriaceae bacterium]|nr:serine/threonine-protein kinase [Kofleriaceae bacterium]
MARLGSGGMAEVWKATASGPGGFQRTVVLKRILPHLAHDERFLSMFLSEARLSARLHHGNVVDVFACGEIDGRYYLAMEYVRGHDLSRVLGAHATLGPPHPGLASFVTREICRALAYAHALAGEDGRPLGLVHRDVSLSNVMLSYDGAVKLLDFGIAKALGELRDAETRSSRLEGKQGYFAPEALAGRGIDARADQYAAGVVMYELLTGTRLFPRESGRVRGPVTPPSSINKTVPAELDRICLRALEEDREQRFATCEEMAIALDRAAHQLAWGPPQIAELLMRILPEARAAAPPIAGTEPMSVPPPAALPQTRLAGSQPTRLHLLPPWWKDVRVWAAGAAVMLAVGLAWLIARSGAPPPPGLDDELPGIAAPGVGPARDAARAPAREPIVTPLPSPETRPGSPPAATVEPAEPPRPPRTLPPKLRAKPTKRERARENLLKGDVLDPFSQ